VGRREFSTPYVNRQFNRMTPNTFEAIALKGSFAGPYARKFDYEVGYLSKVKLRDADTFIPMSQAVPFATAEQGQCSRRRCLRFTTGRLAWRTTSSRYPQHLLCGGDLGAGGEVAAGFKLSAQFTDEREAGGLANLGQVLSRNIGCARPAPGSPRCSTSPCPRPTRMAISSAVGIESTYTNAVLKNSNRAGKKRRCSASPMISVRKGSPGERIDHSRRGMECARPRNRESLPRSPSST